MKVLFHTNTINYRGTTVAVTDYARYNQEILGNESIIAYNEGLGYEKDMGSEQTVVDNLKKSFNVIGYKSNTLADIIEREKVDVSYFIKAGNIDGELPPNPKDKKLVFPTNCKTAVHAVFQFFEPHGDRYAYISEWLTNKMTNGEYPYVPHIVKLPQARGTYRKALGIREDQIVVGRIGGYYTFDLIFVKDYIINLVMNDTKNKFVFLFVGTEPFIDHPNVKFINEIYDPQKKADFINTCDCMLHARSRGESFGLSIAEFLYMDKPVLAWNNGHDRNHIEMLKHTGTLYNDPMELNDMLHNIKDFNTDWTSLVAKFAPEVVMKKFNEVFLL